MKDGAEHFGGSLTTFLCSLFLLFYEYNYHYQPNEGSLGIPGLHLPTKVFVLVSCSSLPGSGLEIEPFGCSFQFLAFGFEWFFSLNGEMDMGHLVNILRLARGHFSLLIWLC